MCLHRLGMICAAGHDPRAARQLLSASKAHYAAQANFWSANPQYHRPQPPAKCFGTNSTRPRAHPRCGAC